MLFFKWIFIYFTKGVYILIKRTQLGLKNIDTDYKNSYFSEMSEDYLHGKEM